MTPRRICVVTGSRADYGLLVPVLHALAADPAFVVQVAVTGMHLAPEFGLTVREVEADGWDIAGRVESLADGDGAAAVASSIGRGTAGFGRLFATLRPDLVMLLGDRYEILAAGNAAMVAGLPVAHLCGGDVTYGAYDDSIRHALTKLAHLHFVTHDAARQRVIQLGESPAAVFDVGSPGLDALRATALPDRTALAADLRIDADATWLLFTFHPATRDPEPSIQQMAAALAALDVFIARGLTVVATQPNADNDGRALTAQLHGWARDRPTVRVFASLGQTRYLGVMRHAAAVVGNSSSGLYEAPSLKVATVNIGSRQDGRPRASSVIDCGRSTPEITAAIDAALTLDCRSAVNPFGDGNAAARIVAVLRAIPDFGALTAKHFHDLPFALPAGGAQ